MHPKLARKVRLIGPDGVLLGSARDEVVAEMLRRGHAEPVEGFGRGRTVMAVRVCREGLDHPCRTRISVGSAAAAAGRSQVYTRLTRSAAGTAVHSFKAIHAEDLPAFYQATGGRYGYREE